MKRSSNRILTTHTGSLARPEELLEMMDAKLRGKSYDEKAFRNRIRSSVAEMVRRQVDCGIDIVTDGEQSKPSFNAYLVERLTGFEPVASSEERVAAPMKSDEALAFPEYYEKYFAEHMCSVGPNQPVACTGPIAYKGQDLVRTDIENLQAALKGLSPEEVFMPAIAPGVFSNITATRRNFSLPWPKRCGSNTWQLSTRAFFYKSTTLRSLGFIGRMRP